MPLRLEALGKEDLESRSAWTSYQVSVVTKRQNPSRKKIYEWGDKDRVRE